MDAVPGRPTWAEIDLGALRRNLGRLRERAGPRRVIGVVKADGYGHGARRVAGALVDAGCEALAVATLEEALELREAEVRVPVLLLQGLHAPEQAEAALEAQLHVAIVDGSALEPLAAAGRRAGRPLAVHLKVDTGMGRLGVWPEQVDALLERLAGESGLVLEGLMTHLAEADDRDASATRRQRCAFAAVCERVRARGFAPAWVHADPSAAVLEGPSAEANAVRPGIALYGVDPRLRRSPGAPAAGLEPVMTLRTRVLALKDAPAGTRVGYGGTHVCPRPTRLAALPIGYADGLARASGGRFAVGVAGARVPLVGRVSMDVAVADVGELPVRPGDEVLIFGRAEGLEIEAAELADALGTIAYEVFVGVGPRIPRRERDARPAGAAAEVEVERGGPPRKGEG